VDEEFTPNHNDRDEREDTTKHWSPREGDGLVPATQGYAIDMRTHELANICDQGQSTCLVSRIAASLGGLRTLQPQIGRARRYLAD
jgi:hypothetical protein